MKRFSIPLICLVTAVLPLQLAAQSAPRAVEGFESENAILDTSLPFAIGAREARQSLRGSFGWPTFQEGLVEGVYFRFDPDGYARFSPSPRLDSDVFEVICRPRTFSCYGRKDGLSVTLTGRGLLQMKFDDVVSGDTFHLSEGVSELQLPERILQPLDLQLETLLSGGGDLIVRRGGQENANISLRGFSAVSAYLKWVMARQDYTVLPRGWPVPNSKHEETGGEMTRPADWASPMPQPQIVVGASPSAVAPPVPVTALAPVDDEAREIAELRAELKLLRDVLLAQQTGAATGMEEAMPTDRVRVDMEVAERLATLQTAAEDIRREIEGLHSDSAAQNRNTAVQPQFRAEQSGPTTAPIVPALDISNTVADVPGGRSVAMDVTFPNTAPAAMPEVQPEAGQGVPGALQQDFSARLVYLIEEVGLSPEVALSVLRSVESDPAATSISEAAPRPAASALYQGSDVVSQILAELEADITAEVPTAENPEPTVNDREYQLLSDYFQSVVLPDLQP